MVSTALNDEICQKPFTMRKIYTCFVLFVTTLVSAQCPSGDVNLSNQAQVNAFLATNPNCTTINGTLTITGTNITSLEPLHNLTTITGGLTIYNNPQLTTLSGLQNLRTVGGYFAISNNNTLTNITNLSQLTSTGNFVILSCPLLTSLNGLQSLSTIGGLFGIENLGISNFDGLNNLTSIGRYMEIKSCPNLASMAGLSNLTSISGYIHLQNNPMLTTVSGLDNIDSHSIDTITIRNCPNLSFCSVRSFCEFLGPIGSGTLNNNATGCNSVAEIQNICQSLSTTEHQIEVFGMYPNPTSESISFNTQKTVKSLTISDISGKNILQNTNFNKTAINVSNFKSGIYFISAEIDGTIYRSKFIKK